MQHPDGGRASEGPGDIWGCRISETGRNWGGPDETWGAASREAEGTRRLRGKT